MGLASAMVTAVTGLTAAETKIDVAGNNLANGQTVGFKESSVTFANQFLQTYGLGSAPSSQNGGTNPRQVGLGVQVSAITPEFSQGAVEISGSPSHLAIQGDGFFIVEDSGGGQLYTRAGNFSTNAENELVTPTGNRLLGYGVDDSFQIQQTDLVPLEIPLGQAAVAKATENVVVQGTLTPTAELADVAQVIQSSTLGNGSIPRADATGVSVGAAAFPSSAGVSTVNVDGGGSHAEGSVYQYRFVYIDSSGTESMPTDAISVTVPAGDTLANNTINLNNLPPATGDYNSVRIYRTAAGGSDFFLLDTAAAGGSYADTNSVSLSSTPLDTTSLSGNYTYMITYATSGAPESRPTPYLGPVNIANGRIQLTNLPTPPTPGPGDTFPAYDEIRIYRNIQSQSDAFYLVGSANPGDSFTDGRSDAEISDLGTPPNKEIDLDGPRINTGTLLVDVVKRDGQSYEDMFQEGTLTFQHKKGDRTLGTGKEFTITDTTTVQDLIDFMEDAMGIFKPAADSLNPVPTSLNLIPGESGTLTAGGSIVDGKLRFVSNNGDVNAIEIGLGGFTIVDTNQDLNTPNLGFGTVQQAQGEGVVADFLAYDSLGVPVPVRITTVLEEISGSATVYRWFAESAENDPLSGDAVAVGTGRITFDGEGNFVSVTNDTVSVERRNTPAASPLEFALDFSRMSGLASAESTMSVSRQDGSPPGVLTSYVIGENGLISGVFSNGTVKDLGQIRMAKFANPQGLEQRGQNMYAAGVNSGISFSDPGQDGAGKLLAGSLELSNVNVGRNLISLTLASTLYRGNSRVINTSQSLLDELMNLRQ
ncbi:MAG: flagellar hook-basal body complex protein [Planctomycetales bacterium]|nr:flagellar hook-basal body complex protein [Planctomycetales bacterium]